MKHLANSAALSQTVIASLRDIPWPSDDASGPVDLLTGCPRAAITPLVASAPLAARAGVATVHVKDERARMGLGSFKALGAAYVIACDAADGTAAGRTYVTASAGNHGLSVAAGASAFGAKAVVFLANTVPRAFAKRLTDLGAEVQWQGATYEASMEGASTAAQSNGWTLLSDSSWPGYTKRPHRLMEGYLTLMAEAVSQMPAPPTHVFLQAGVGGLAAACAAFVRKSWGAGPRIIVVEPEAAPAIFQSMQAGHSVVTTGPTSAMGRLDCKEPSLIALKGLARDATDFITISEDEGENGNAACKDAGLPTTPSGAAGVAGLLTASDVGLVAEARVLVILSEAAT